MLPTELHALLARFDATPIHDRGQHFLLDDAVVEKMIATANVSPQDTVVEIGPGPGILTEKLLATGAQIIAIELDKKLCQLLRQRFPAEHYQNFTLIEGDALQYTSQTFTTTPYKVVANVPYNITSAILQKFLFETPKPVSLTLMIQREVAERITAAPGTMSSLAIMVQTYGTAKIVCHVPATAFFPPPQVDSSVIHIELFSTTTMADFFGDVSPEQFFALVQVGFSAPRRQLHHNIHQLFGTHEFAKSALDKAKIAPRARPQELSVSNWHTLAHYLPEKT